MHGDLQPRVGGRFRPHQDARRSGFTVFQVDAATQRLQDFVCHLAVHADEIVLGHMTAGVGERMGQLPIVGAQQRAL